MDIFTVGSDWQGKFDYLNEYCKVIYLPRTEGVSSTDIRKNVGIRMGMVGYSTYLKKVYNEYHFVNELFINGIYTQEVNALRDILDAMDIVTDNYEELLGHVGAVYIHSHPSLHYEQIKKHY